MPLTIQPVLLTPDIERLLALYSGLLGAQVAMRGIGGASLDEVLARVEGLGGRVLAEPNDMPWGQRVAHILDPDGNAVNLTSPVLTTATAPG
jgi:catechol 2,3-dioxygenase-like lactoylglutathione lyase family enzyme